MNSESLLYYPAILELQRASISGNGEGTPSYATSKCFLETLPKLDTKKTRKQTIGPNQNSRFLLRVFGLFFLCRFRFGLGISLCLAVSVRWPLGDDGIPKLPNVNAIPKQSQNMACAMALPCITPGIGGTSGMAPKPFLAT